MLSSTSAGAARRLHHRRGHVAAGDDRVLRAGAGVHQVGLVEEVAVELASCRVLHQHLAEAWLMPASSLCVLCVANTSLVLGPRAVLAHRVEAAVELVEGRVRQPGLVEMQVVDVAVERRA
jgi:hypothetical protein